MTNIKAQRANKCQNLNAQKFRERHHDCLDQKREKGFTLLEVMVALSILGIALTVLIQLFSGGLRQAKNSRDYTKAVLYAKQVMEEMAMQEYLTEGVEQGDLAEGYRWQVTISPQEISTEEDFPLELYRLRVDIFFTQGEKEKKVELSTLKTVLKQNE